MEPIGKVCPAGCCEQPLKRLALSWHPIGALLHSRHTLASPGAAKVSKLGHMAPKRATAPPTKRKKRAVGLLGVALPSSEDDDDYVPPGGSSAGGSGSGAASRRQQRQQGGAEEEDLPLAQRRKQLLKARRSSGAGSAGASPVIAGAAGAATAGGAAAAAAAAASSPVVAVAPEPAGPAIHLPEEVLVHILRLACSPASGGAVPTASAGAGAQLSVGRKAAGDWASS